jgi:hypothetical protein
MVRSLLYSRLGRKFISSEVEFVALNVPESESTDVILTSDCVGLRREIDVIVA